MDIAYLLFLQDIRSVSHDALTPLMEWISLFAVTWLVLAPTVIYWCADKKKGLYILASMTVCVAFNAVIKLTACVYRPWIRDARILPAGDAIATATGYSFPSGHTTTATPVYGGLAVAYWARRNPWVWLCLGLLALTGFSRNYLGVHTPQDVLAGLCLGAAVLFGTARLFARLAAHPEEEDRWLLGGFLFGAAALAYITLKPYPLDYVDGKLLVDPRRMTVDGFKDIGAFMAFCAARWVEKRWVRFRAPGLNARGIALAALGVALLSPMRAWLILPLRAALGPHWGGLLGQAVFVFYVIALWPAVIRRFGGEGADDARTGGKL